MTAGSGYFYFFSLLRGLGDWSCSLQSGLSFLSDAGQQFLDLSDGAARVKTLRTGLGAVHDGVAPVHTEGVPELVQPLCLVSVPAVNDPPVSLHQYCRAQVSVPIPPVAGTGGAAAGTQDALVQPVQLGSVPDTLEELLVSVLHTALVIPLQPGLDTSVLLVEIVHVRHQVLHHVHVRQWVDLDLLIIGFYLCQAGEGVDPSDIHGTGATDSLPAGPPEGQAGVYLILDLHQRVQHHRPAVVQINLVILHLRFAARLLRVKSVDGECLLLLGCRGHCSPHGEVERRTGDQGEQLEGGCHCHDSKTLVEVN